ncbi:MAG: ATP-dependent Clp protease ATP-binding subunit [Acidobacteria bacterium]|nr:ATP-dependent Clp protease ATP-binding subunit [Acidobacteriota bacterium]
MLEKFTEKAKRILFLARYEASQTGSKVIGTEHMLLGIIKENEDITAELLARSNINVDLLRAELEARGPSRERTATSVEIPFSDEVKRVLGFAEEEAERLLHPSIGTEHLLLGLLREENSTAGRVLTEKGMSLYMVREDLVNVLKKRSSPRKKKETPFLSEFARDFSVLAAKNSFDPLIGRGGELERMIQVLSRRRKNNPVLIGEPGVGKTAIVEGLAARIYAGEVPQSLIRKRILALDLPLVVAGTKYRGQFEERLKGIIAELTASQDIIIFIDEIHSLIGAGSAEGSLDAANILKPTLSRGEVQCIGATTPRDYHKHIEKDRALVRRFQPIKVVASTEAETIDILHGIKERYERFHQVRYTDEAIAAAVYQAGRYISDRFLPDKAIDVIDEAGARVKLGKKNSYTDVRAIEKEIDQAVEKMRSALSQKDFDAAVRYHDQEVVSRKRHEELLSACEGESQRILDVKREDVEDVISRWTGVPLESVHGEEMERLMKIEEGLHRRVVGQEEAISALARAIRRSRAGLRDQRRPVGVFLFLGPTGVGKTEVARTLAEFLFGHESAMIRFDMSEFMEKHSVAKMIGSPPGYVGHEEGGLLTERVKRKPYSVVLLDEIEKAHPDILNILLQVFDEGRLQDAYGDTIDFASTILIMTSNIGSKTFTGTTQVGFGKEESQSGLSAFRRGEVLKEVKRTLSPEFINRIDEQVVFAPLTDDELRAIARLMVDQLNKTLSDKGIILNPHEEVYDWLIQTICADRVYGARPLRRAIQKHIEDALSEKVIRGEMQNAGEVEIRLQGGKLVFQQMEMINSLDD